MKKFVYILSHLDISQLSEEIEKYFQQVSPSSPTDESSDSSDKGEGAKGGGEQVNAKDLDQGGRGHRAPQEGDFKIFSYES